jgi:NCS1 family nucleobase:cation symporter-1
MLSARTTMEKVSASMVEKPRHDAGGLSQVEIRSIDQIPPEERHGKIRDQFTLWFALNANIFYLVLGGVVIFLGLNFVWSCIAIVTGVCIGLFLVGFHAMQGPKLGVPQMIQSRGQFGFYGAVLVFAGSIVLDFSRFTDITGSSSSSAGLPSSSESRS